MGHHITGDGKFQSDKHPHLEPNKFLIDIDDDPAAWDAALAYADRTPDDELAEDLRAAVANARRTMRERWR